MRLSLATDCGETWFPGTVRSRGTRERSAAWPAICEAIPLAAPSRCGSVTFVQRFGSALNVHVHFHALLLDGSYVDDEEVSPGPLVKESPALARMTAAS